MVGEVWKPVEGFPGYEVSNLGRVRSFRGGNGRCARSEPRLLKPAADKDGYALVVLCRDAKRFTRRIPTLVAETFIGPRPKDMQVCHGVAGRSDNSVTNLSWGTRSKNHGEDRRRDGTDNRGGRNGRAKLGAEDIPRIRVSSVEPLAKKKLANEMGISISTINDIQKGRTWTHV